MRLKNIPAKYLYVVSAIIFWVSTIVLLLLWHDGQQNLSGVANTNWYSYIYYLMATALVSTIIWLFLDKYFFGQIRASKYFKFFYKLSLTMIIVTAAIPYNLPESSWGQLHRLTGAVGFFASIAMFTLLIRDKAVHPSVRLYVFGAITIGMLLFLSQKSILSQCVFIALGQSGIMLAAYTQPRKIVE